MLDSGLWACVALAGIFSLVYAWCYAVQRYEAMHVRSCQSRERQAANTLPADESWRIRVAELDKEARIECARIQYAVHIAPEKPEKAPTLSGQVQLPDDLEAHCLSWADEWARDDERALCRARYLEYHTGNADETWQKVRRSIGIGEMP